MKKYKDAKTGEYISKAQAEKQDPATWVEVNDFDKGKFLEKVFKDLEAKSYTTGFSSEIVLPLRTVVEVFNELGAKIEF